MKISEAWLREWCDPKISITDLAEKLTMAGIEVEEIIAEKPNFTKVVIGKVLDLQPHPDADKLRVCTVDVNGESNLQIVCGAKNVHQDALVPVAVIGARLDDGNFKIKKSKLRGVESQGMICSESELGLADSSEGIWLLSQDAPVGVDLIEYLNLNKNDNILDISITPNRGDCLSARGLGREVAVLNNQKLADKYADLTLTESHKNKTKININTEDKDLVSNFLSINIENIDNTGAAPMWMIERLRRSGINSISTVVDITNYVMLELGQPMHAFDLDKLSGDITVRKSKSGESLELLNGKTVKFDDSTLLITDDEKILNIAGIIGGLKAGVTKDTKNILLEVATYKPETIGRAARSYSVSTDSSQRYERGVDYSLPKLGITRAANLLVDLCGGQCGPVSGTEHNIEPKIIKLSKNIITKILGVEIEQNIIDSILLNLGLKNLTSDKESTSWQVPPHRYDLLDQIDLVEEVARVYGYTNLPSKMPERELKFVTENGRFKVLNKIRSALQQQSYSEAISYSFCSPKTQALLDKDNEALELINPISEDLKAMRTTVVASLLPTVKYNFDHQNTRIKLFEIGSCYHKINNEIIESERVALVISGARYLENWLLNSKEKFDFYDLKADLMSLLNNFNFKSIEFKEVNKNKILHPVQSAEIFINGVKCGFIGALHPAIQQKLELSHAVIVAEIDAKIFSNDLRAQCEVVSKYPAVRRDLAIVINNHITAQKITDLVANTVKDLLKSINIFDVYTGSNIIKEGSKSLAISLVMQASDRTLVDDEVSGLINQVLANLKSEYNATIRE